MSSYWIDQINGTLNIHILGKVEVKEAIGEVRVEKIKINGIDHEETDTRQADAK